MSTKYKILHMKWYNMHLSVMPSGSHDLIDCVWNSSSMHLHGP